jgi:hypothetical protein
MMREKHNRTHGR